MVARSTFDPMGESDASPISMLARTCDPRASYATYNQISRKSAFDCSSALQLSSNSRADGSDEAAA